MPNDPQQASSTLAFLLAQLAKALPDGASFDEAATKPAKVAPIGANRTRPARAADFLEPHPLAMTWVTAATRQGQPVPVERRADGYHVLGVTLDPSALIAANGRVQVEVVVPLDGVATRIIVRGWVALPVPMTLEDLE